MSPGAQRSAAPRTRRRAAATLVVRRAHEAIKSAGEAALRVRRRQAQGPRGVVHGAAALRHAARRKDVVAQLELGPGGAAAAECGQSGTQHNTRERLVRTGLRR